jgi:hypothetical protein
MSHMVINPMRQVSKSRNDICNKINLYSESMSHNTCTLLNSVIQSKSPIKMHIKKITSTLLGEFQSKLERDLRCISK